MTITEMPKLARLSAAAIAVVATITLAVRFYLRWQQSESVLAALSYMAQYFTLLTNTMTLLLMLWITMGRPISLQLIKAIIIAIVLVGVLYHALLSHLVSLSGIELWADHGTHTFVPVLSGLWWVFLAPKPDFRWSDVGLWLIWPILYVVYIMTRASFSGFYPYPFLNLPEIGWGGLIPSVAGLLVAFVVVGWLMTFLGRYLGPQPD